MYVLVGLGGTDGGGGVNFGSNTWQGLKEGIIILMFGATVGKGFLSYCTYSLSVWYQKYINTAVSKPNPWIKPVPLYTTPVTGTV
jgi:hypothetical protein